MKKVDIVVVGSCMIDFVSYAPRLPTAGETIHGSKFATNFGGKGANQCVACAKLGGKTALIARVGDDKWADDYIDNLHSLQIDTEYVRKTSNCHTGIAQIIVSDQGENQIVIVSGSNNQLSPQDLDSARKLISDAKVVVVQLETSQAVAVAALKIAEGISILNGAPGLSVYDKDLLILPTIFCVNETEASLFTGLSVQNIGEAKKATEKLIELGCKNVILTLGADGALYMNNEVKNIIHIKSPVTKCVDSTGAGDCFIGSLAYLLVEYKMTIEKAIGYACQIAADSVTRCGTQISFPDNIEKIVNID